MYAIRSYYALAVLAAPLQAEEAPLRPSAGLLFKHPELLRPGTCTMYREGGAGWLMPEPLYYLRGTVLSSEVTTRHLNACPRITSYNVCYTKLLRPVTEETSMEFVFAATLLSILLWVAARSHADRRSRHATAADFRE